MNEIYWLLALYVIIIIYDTYRIKKYKKITGYVKEINEEYDSNLYGDSNRKYSYKVTYEYTYKGKVYTCNSYFSYKISIPQIGDTKDIYVNSKKPAKALTQDEKLHHELIMIAILVVLLIMILMQFF